MFSDFIYIALSAVAFALTWGFVRICERV